MTRPAEPLHATTSDDRFTALFAATTSPTTTDCSRIAMNIQTLNCKGCGAGLPAPVGPTVECEFCGAAMAVTRPRDGSNTTTIASKDSPARVWLPLARSATSMHLWLLDSVANTPHVDPAFLRSLASRPLKQHTSHAWVFTAQSKGGFTAMVGVHEKRIALEKSGNTVKEREVTETRWTPFSSQLRFSRTLACSSGTTDSVELARRLNASPDLKGVLRRGAELEHDMFPAKSAERAWADEGTRLLDVEQMTEANALLQGDESKNIKFNMETSWQPLLVCAELGSVETTAGTLAAGCLGSEPFVTSPLRSVPRSLEREARLSSARKRRMKASALLFGTAMSALLFAAAVSETHAALALIPIAAALGIVFKGPKLLACFQEARRELAAVEAELSTQQARELAEVRAQIQGLYP